MLRNLRVGARLAVAFAVVLLLLLTVEVMGISRMQGINADIEQLVEMDWQKVKILNEVAELAQENAAASMQLFLVRDATAQTGLQTKIEGNRKAISERLDRFEKLIRTQDGKTLLGKLTDARAPYVASFTSMAKRLVDEKKVDEAKAIMLDETLPALGKYMGVLNDLVAYQGKLFEDTAASANHDYESGRSLLIGIGVLAILLVLAFGIVITRSITRPLRSAVDVAGQIAQGDLTAVVEVPSKDETGRLLQSMKDMIEKLSGVIGDVCGAADNLSSASEEVSATAQQLSGASNEQAASVEEISSSVEEMTASISQNTENAKVTDSMATKAATEASEGGDAVKQTVDAMKRIAEKISIIDDIAYQTNLLALNAAIEAARAGEHGKGFAVVAAEVRKLAERSQVAALEIGEVASSSVGLAERAGKLLTDMVPSIKKTSDLVQEITAASQEQSSGVVQINSAMTQLNQGTQQNAASSEELAATAEEMSSQAQQLQQTMAFFKIKNARAAAQPVVRAEPQTFTPPARKPAAVPRTNGSFARPLVVHGPPNGANGHPTGVALDERDFSSF